jgi:hypothetical protein
MPSTNAGFLGSLDSLGIFALQVVFALAALTPIVIVLLYRITRVDARCGEIRAIMKAAFGKSGGSGIVDQSYANEQKQARAALDNNPYISDLDVTFEACHSWKHYIFPFLSLATLTAALCAILYAWTRIQLSDKWGGGPISHIPTPIVMALAGGYVWSLYQIVSRVKSDELGPSDLGEISLGLMACVPVGFAFSILAVTGLASFAAFLASSFPMREAQRFLQEQALKRALGTEVTAAASRPNERHLGTAIDGVSDQTLVRLRELRIVTVLDMAYSDPIKIMLQTGYALPLIIDWMDQSLWALYAGEARNAMIKNGIRCALDVYEFVELHCLWDKTNNLRGVPTGPNLAALEEVATTLGTSPGLAHDLFLRIYGDPQVIVLRRLWYVNGVPASVTCQACQ